MRNVVGRARAAVSVLAIMAATPAVAQLVPNPPPVEPGQVNLFFDYFLFDNGGQPAQNFNTFFLWNVTNGSVDLLGDGFVSTPQGGTLPINLEGRFVDLGGSIGNPGLFETRRDFAVTSLDTYRLRFRYRSVDGSAESASVALGGRTFDVATSSTDFTQFDQTFQFTDLNLLNLAGLVRLSFQGNEANTDNSGIGIDSVLFDQVLPTVPSPDAGAVPEPASWALMAVGFGVVGMSARRRRKMQAQLG